MDFTVEQMMKDGFTIKMANFYHELMKKERNSGLWSDEFIDWAHNNGFLAESAVAYNLTEENKDDYLSDYDYLKIWPLNSWERIWINDICYLARSWTSICPSIIITQIRQGD